MKLEKGIYFISGIDTDIGKTVGTGILARELMAQGRAVITQKMVQTGCEFLSEDIEEHRRWMGLAEDERFLEDKEGLTAPQIFAYPASPHLATKLENKSLDLALIEQATQVLAERYEVVLLEGAGGLMVPLTEELLCIDYVATKGYPSILVTSGRLGSINHTLLSLHALRQYQITLHGLIYNAHHDSEDSLIAMDTQRYLQDYLQKHFPAAQFYVVPGQKA